MLISLLPWLPVLCCAALCCAVLCALCCASQVTIVEASLTLVQFVLLLVIGWAVDVRVWRRGHQTLHTSDAVMVRGTPTNQHHKKVLSMDWPISNPQNLMPLLDQLRSKHESHWCH